MVWRVQVGGAPSQSHPNSAVPWKFTSTCDSPGALKNVCIRALGLPTLIPDCPPSPKIVTNQLSGVKFAGLEACVPLSCVPPMMSWSGFCTLTDRLWNWSVPSPLFSVAIVVGTAESQCWQSGSSAPVRLRVLHLLDTSVNPSLEELPSLHTPHSSLMNPLIVLHSVFPIHLWPVSHP